MSLVPLLQRQRRLAAARPAPPAYRDYLDRFRYYTDARGLDLAVWVRWSFGNAVGR